jgi:phospholipase C
MTSKNNLYFLSINHQANHFDLWKFDPNQSDAFHKMDAGSNAKLSPGDQAIQVGNYLLIWSIQDSDSSGESHWYNFNLYEIDITQKEWLGSKDSKNNWTTNPVQAGKWDKSKFFGSRADFANPEGAKKGYEDGSQLVLLSLHQFILNWIPTEGRGTYQLFNFDHGSADILPAPLTPQGAWLTVQKGHELIHTHGYVLDWQPATADYDLWQFDASNEDPLSYPSVNKGNLASLGIDAAHKLSAIGDYIMDWNITDNSYRLWRFDQYADCPLQGPIATGAVPSSFQKTTELVPVETLIAVDQSQVNTPGTIDFMRDKVEHVVYYMIENRSLDHVCGWLYDQGAKINVIGPQGPYKGVDPNFYNEYLGKKYPITQYFGGKLSNDPPFKLDLDEQDPYHDNSDVLRQMFYGNIQDYHDKKEPDMGGFAWNNGTDEVMKGYSKEQLPVLNGLAENFAISDDWFCSMPGGTDVNRAFALTGSSLGQLNNFQNGVQYAEWWQYAHRPSIWKILWSNGFKDFKIYNSVEWIDCRFTYNLFLKGQIPSIDDPFVIGDYAPQMNQFFDDLKYGTLPKFSFLEPKWVASAGSTSYHPGNDLIPGERALKDIFDAIQNSEYRDKVLFVITFDEHGGLPDHVKPPYCQKPYANDSILGFDFDIMGVRIPTILTSSYIKKNSVFRSSTGTSFDSTSILSTLLQWAGIPKSRWGLGERTYHAPSFENVLQETAARKDEVKLDLPYDSLFPKPVADEEPKVNAELGVHDLHRLLIPRMITELTPAMEPDKRSALIRDVLNHTHTQNELIERLNEIEKQGKESLAVH